MVIFHGKMLVHQRLSTPPSWSIGSRDFGGEHSATKVPSCPSSRHPHLLPEHQGLQSYPLPPETHGCWHVFHLFTGEYTVLRAIRWCKILQVSFFESVKKPFCYFKTWQHGWLTAHHHQILGEGGIFWFGPLIRSSVVQCFFRFVQKFPVAVLSDDPKWEPPKIPIKHDQTVRLCFCFRWENHRTSLTGFFWLSEIGDNFTRGFGKNAGNPWFHHGFQYVSMLKWIDELDENWVSLQIFWSTMEHLIPRAWQRWEQHWHGHSGFWTYLGEAPKISDAFLLVTCPWNKSFYPLVNVYITMENHHF